MADPGEDGEINKRAGGGQNQHGDADGVLMPASGRGVDAAGRGQSGEADGDADSADGQHRSAEALRQGDDQAGEAHGAGSIEADRGCGARRLYLVT